MTEHLHFVWDYNARDREFWNEHFESRLPASLIDAHIHLDCPEFHYEEMTEEMRKQYWVNEVNSPLTADELDHADRLVYPNRKVKHLVMGFPSLELDVERSNDYVSAQAAKRGWPALTMLIPQWTPQRLEKELEKPNIIGVKPYYSLIGRSPESRDEYLEADIFDFMPHSLLEVMNEKKAWVTLHVPKAGRLPAPNNIKQIQEIRKKYPDIILVIAHIGRCYSKEHAVEGITPLAEDEGLYFDSSAVINPEAHTEALKLIGRDRLIYGSDNPIFYMRGRRQIHGLKYVNRTSYPFYFNKEREPEEVEMRYTLMMYEDIKSVLSACDACGCGDAESIEKIFYSNAKKLMDRAMVGKGKSWL